MGRAFVLVCVLLLVLATAATAAARRRATPTTHGRRRRPRRRSTGRRRSPSRTARTTPGTTAPSPSRSPPRARSQPSPTRSCRWTAASPRRPPRWSCKAPRTHADDGEHVLTFWSVDADGRTETPQTVTVKIDTQPPAIPELRLRPDVLRRVQPVDVGFSLSDISGGARLSYTVLDQYGYLARRGRGISVGEGARTIDIPDRYGNGKALVPGPLPRHAHVHGPGREQHRHPAPRLPRLPPGARLRHVHRQGRRQARRAHLRRRRTRVGVGAHARHAEEVPHARDVLRHRPLRVGGAARRAARRARGARHRLARLDALADDDPGLRRRAPRAGLERGALVARRARDAGRLAAAAVRRPQQDDGRGRRLRRLPARRPVGRRPRRLARLRSRAPSPPTRSRTCTPGRSSACTCARTTMAALPTILRGLRARGYRRSACRSCSTPPAGAETGEGRPAAPTQRS